MAGGHHGLWMRTAAARSRLCSSPNNQADRRDRCNAFQVTFREVTLLVECF
jgi:hypothetical protein